MIDLNEEVEKVFSHEQVIDHIKSYIDKISYRYTKYYGIPALNENLF